MKRLPPIAIVLLTLSGCQFEPVVWVANRLNASHCEARTMKPGTRYRYIDYDNGGGWVEVGEDGKRQPIPSPEADDVKS